MGKITGGSVKYGRTVKTGDFENKRVDVELQFGVDDGEDHAVILQLASKEAHDKAHAMLGLKKAEEVKAPLVNEPKAEPKAEKPKGKTKADLEAEKKADLEKPKAEPKPEPKKADDNAFDEAAPENEPEVTDMMISTALNKQIAILKPKHGEAAGKLLRALIAEFVEPPKKSSDIPQNVRGTFLKKLAAIT